ncbi:AAA family ATPase [Rhodococcus sp. NPDC055024]
MKTRTGGVAAAFGFRYQYLVTIEYFLSLMRAQLSELNHLTFHVEATTGAVADPDKVDFSISLNGSSIENIQVKSTLPGAETLLNVPEVVSIFDGLAPLEGTAAAYLVTNRQPNDKLKNSCTVLVQDQRGRQQYRTQSGGVIIVDERSIGVIRDSVIASIQEFRRDRHLSLGALSSRLILAELLEWVFEAAAGSADNSLTAFDMITKLHAKDQNLAHALGTYDWGVARTAIPYGPSPVPRQDMLATLSEHLDRCLDRRVPQAVFLHGPTGVGKSVIAADFCHLSRNSFESVYWIDCSHGPTSDAMIRDLLLDAGQSEFIERESMYRAFKQLFANQPGPWILVLDGIKSSRDAAKMSPTVGNGVIVVTTPNSTGWGPDGTSVEVLLPSHRDAEECFFKFAGIEPNACEPLRATVSTIVERLGRLPMAVSMAGLYFKNSGEDVRSLAPHYFKSLDALSEISSAPAHFDQTAFTAVELAISRLRADHGTVSPKWSRPATHFLNAAAFLHPAQIPVHLLTPVSIAEGGRMNIAEPPVPVFASQTDVNGIVTALRTQTLVHRGSLDQHSDSSNPAADTVTLHPLIHEITRILYLRTVPPEFLAELGCLLMFHLYGWVSHLRQRGDYTPMERVCMHADAVVQHFDMIPSMSGIDTTTMRFFELSRAMLRSEMAARFARRDSFEFSTRCLDESLNELQRLPQTDALPAAFVLKALSDRFSDACAASFAETTIKGYGEALIEQARLVVSADHESVIPMAFRLIKEATTSIAGIKDDHVRSRMQPTLQKFQEFLDSDPVHGVTIHDVMAKAQELVSRRKYANALALLPELREASRPSRIPRDVHALEAYLCLRVGKYDDALKAITEYMAEREVLRGAANHYFQTTVNILTAMRETQSDWNYRSPDLRRANIELADLARDLHTRAE